jgi:hypothetical protein
VLVSIISVDISEVSTKDVIDVDTEVTSGVVVNPEVPRVVVRGTGTLVVNDAVGDDAGVKGEVVNSILVVVGVCGGVNGPELNVVNSELVVVGV